MKNYKAYFSNTVEFGIEKTDLPVGEHWDEITRNYIQVFAKLSDAKKHILDAIISDVNELRQAANDIRSIRAKHFKNN